MGIKQMVDVDGDFLSGSEEDFQALDPVRSTPAADTGIDPVDIAHSGFVPATAEQLRHVAPGCFVLVLMDGSYCWAEVVSVEGGWIGGRLHNELSSSPCPNQQPTAATVYFHRQRIRALGCERYCWC